MKRIFGSLFLKLLAIVTVCILTPIFIGCCWFAAEAYEDDMYVSGKTPEFEQTISAESFVAKKLIDIHEYIYWHDITGLIENEYYFNEKNFAFTIYDSEGKKVLSTLKSGITGEPEIHDPEESGSRGYILLVSDYPAKEVTENGEPIAEYAMEGYIKMPMDPGDDGYSEFEKFKFISQYRFEFIRCGIICFIVNAVLCLYLIAGSGYDGNGKLELRGFNAMEYDIMVLLVALGTAAVVELMANLRWAYEDVYKYLCFGLGFAALTLLTLIAVMSTAAHIKIGKLWRHTFIHQCLQITLKFFRWFMRNIGITWKLALAVFGYSFVVYLLGILSTGYNLGAFAVLLALFAVVAGICIIIWFGVQLGKLRRGGEAIANGDFDYRINTRELWPMLRRHAYNLNSAASGMSKAVDDRMKSERFKTELITNVSHDLKTPLTSIVSYVDLLKKEKIENEAASGYIEVIDRQSAKLKKLTEDLVEASKVSSGAVAVNKEAVNIGELINQSVGELAEKLESAEIVPVINLPENDVVAFTDGRLLWRVFDNLIQNIVKYAQPGTRAYFDLAEKEGAAILTIKNISKEPLNMSAEALMERFVRGDTSRNSEGNGLGLSIAKSLTELCGGTFSLALDGDLYKVIITIPETEKSEDK
ncbi:MAG: HAMP domain-containing histidine kinase [Oscillospiraceae bacterium]|nr:HAMP domain-containing histidine kinase [Oscillospiraceae bacterium]